MPLNCLEKFVGRDKFSAIPHTVAQATQHMEFLGTLIFS